MNAQRNLAGLYVILDPSVNPERSLEEVLTESAEAGARLFQYRNKSGSMKEAYDEALILRRMAADLGVTLLVNDRCDLALAVDADGVHLGQQDLPVADARTLLGEGKLIGLSTHNAAQVRAAIDLQPDYIGFGPIFTPFSKQDHDPVVGLAGLKTVRPMTRLPIFAIGGIQSDRAAEVIRAGANGIAVISAVLKAPDVGGAVRELLDRLSATGSSARP